MTDSSDAFVLADAVRAACVDTAVLAYEDAAIRGLCHEGRWEQAIDAIRRLDLRTLTSAGATFPGAGGRAPNDD